MKWQYWKPKVICDVNIAINICTTCKQLKEYISHEYPVKPFGSSDLKTKSVKCRGVGHASGREKMHEYGISLQL